MKIKLKVRPIILVDKPPEEIKVGDKICIIRRGRYWSSAAGGAIPPSNLEYPYYGTVEDVKHFKESPTTTHHVAIKTGGYGFSSNELVYKIVYDKDKA